MDEQSKQLPIDEETLEVLQEALYERLEQPVLKTVREALRQEAAEQPVPLYYDRFVASELRRLEEAVGHNGQRISDLRAEMQRRFAEAKEDREAIRAEMRRGFAEAKEDREAMKADTDRRFAEVREEFVRVHQRLDDVYKRLDDFNKRMDGFNKRMDGFNERMDGFNKRMDELSTSMRNWALLAAAVVSLVVSVVSIWLK